MMNYSGIDLHSNNSVVSVTDGGRMYLQIDKSGSKYWRINYRRTLSQSIAAKTRLFQSNLSQADVQEPCCH
jgi:hypothetical protein